MDIYAEITNRIISEMESGIIPWAKPWVASGGCVSYATGKPYKVIHYLCRRDFIDKTLSKALVKMVSPYGILFAFRLICSTFSAVQTVFCIDFCHCPL